VANQTAENRAAESQTAANRTVKNRTVENRATANPGEHPAAARPVPTVTVGCPLRARSVTP
jgi:hypothetical protein